MKINYLEKIESYWDSEAEEYCNTHPEHLDPSLHPSWGLWHIPEQEMKIFENEDLNHKKIVDLGCGRGHDAVAYANRGAEVVAIDVSKEQLKRAIKHQNVEYIHTCAEKIPVENSSIDMAISDHGAFDHSPAPVLLKEMNRILKPSAQLIICTYSPIAYACYCHETGKIQQALKNEYPQKEVKYNGSLVNSEYSYQEWIKMFCEFNFSIERLEEILVPQNAKSYFSDMVSSEWASKWPCDIIWIVRKNKE